jgi:hypothetical protein
MKLITTQRTVLSSALQRDDGTIALPPNPEGRSRTESRQQAAG